MMLLRLFLLFVGISSGFVFPAEASSDHVVLIIYTGRGDAQTYGNPELDMGYLIRTVQSQFPSSQVLTAEGSDNKTIRNRLAQLMGPSTIVDGVFVESHGSNDNVDPRKCRAWISNKTGTFYVDLDSEWSVNQVFDPILPHLNPNGTRIVFSGCSLLKGCHKSLIPLTMKKVADNFKLTKGGLYMNRTYGINGLQTTYGQPFYSQQSTKTKIASLAAQALPWLGAPLMWFGDYVVFNKGYSVLVDGQRFTVVDDHMFNAQSNPLDLSPLY